VQMKKNISVFTGGGWEHYNADYIEGQPLGSQSIIDMVSVAGATTIAARPGPDRPVAVVVCCPVVVVLMLGLNPRWWLWLWIVLFVWVAFVYGEEPGYLLGERLIRAAKVAVSSPE